MRRLLTLVIVVAGCGSADIVSSPMTTAVPASAIASPVGTQSTAPPTAAAPSLGAACLTPIPHEAPDLEATLPTTIAGRQLAIESYHGTLMVTCVNGGTASDVADLADVLASESLTLDDVGVAVAGRSDVQNDPPYFILAYGLKGHPASEWPTTIGIDFPDLAALREVDIEGKQVLRGEMAGIEQSEHAHGWPYVWNSPTVHYLIVTDDEAWAAEVLRALH